MSSETHIDATNVQLSDTSTKEFPPQFQQTNVTELKLEYLEYTKYIHKRFSNGESNVLDPKDHHAATNNTTKIIILTINDIFY